MPATPPTTTPDPARCIPKEWRTKDVSLPLANGTGVGEQQHPKIKHSRSGKWRAAVLITVQVLIAIHILQWIIMGSTISPVEPSESMQTLGGGVVNAGFVFFVLAILSTIIFGRFFCGWGCHVVALQDLCVWAMTKLKVKPKPFRSRLMVWIPLFIALYMFVWPVFHREVIRRFFADAAGRLPAWLGQSEPLLGFKKEFIVDDFWATFAPWYIAIPFLAVCGFACVYFLGNKGYCTYACPYGGFFGPADKIAPGKIRVTDACEGCGHCTAVCTSNVRVHEEVRDYGMVVDPGCMKCMDCVSVCPNEALYFGFGLPTVLAKPKTPRRLTEEQAAAERARAKAMRASRYDLSWPEEIVFFLVWLVLFFCYRGLAHSVPMLMALGVAAIGAFGVWKCWRMLGIGGEENVRLQSVQLKLKGRLRPAGVVVLAATLLLLVVGAWSGYVQFHVWRARQTFSVQDTPVTMTLAPEFALAPAELKKVQRAIADYTKASSFRNADSVGGQGVGWTLSFDDQINLAYLQLLAGNRAEAERLTLNVVRNGRPRDGLLFQLAHIMSARQAPQEEVVGVFREALARRPELHGIRGQLARIDLAGGGRESALKAFDEQLAAHPDDPDLLFAAASFLAEAGETARATDLAEKLATYGAEHDSPERTLTAAGLLARLRKGDRAAELASIAGERAGRRAGAILNAANALASMGRSEAAQNFARRAAVQARELGPHAALAPTLSGSGFLLLRMGQKPDAMKLFDEATPIYHAGGAWDLMQFSNALMSAAGEMKDEQVATKGLAVAELAAKAAPENPLIRGQLAVLYYQFGRTSDAVNELKAAATTAAENAAIADSLAQLLRELGRHVEADEWFKEGARRRREFPQPGPAEAQPEPVEPAPAIPAPVPAPGSPPTQPPPGGG